MTVVDQIIRHLMTKRRILVATHTHPDGDAVGSLVAMGLALYAADQRPTFYIESPIPAVYRFLPSVSRIQRHIEDLTRFDTAVILDCGDLDRIGARGPALARIPTVINIDHHVTNSGFGTIQLVDTNACATAEIVYRLIRRMDVPVDADMATAIYTGIFTDTGSFRFSNTNRSAFAICEEMVQRGVDPYQVAQKVYGTYSLGRIKLLNMALDSIEISENGKLSVMTLTQRMFEETGTHPEDVDGIINYARRIEDVQVAVLILENETNGNGAGKETRPFHISLRSDGTVDVSAIAAHFGGGGHRSAAGFNIESRIAELKSEIIDLSETI